MKYERPEMEFVELEEELLTVSVQPGDVTEGGGLPEIDMSGEE